MSNWIASITGIIVLSILIDIIIPEGGLNKYIKRVFGIILLIAIVTPICAYLGGGINLDKIIYLSNYRIDCDYLDRVDDDIANECVSLCCRALSDEGIDCDIDMLVENLEVEKINIKIKKEVIENNQVNIDIRTKILDIVTAICRCDGNKVTINGIG